MNKIIYVLLESCVASTTVLYRWLYFCNFLYFYSSPGTVKRAVLFILKCVAVEGNHTFDYISEVYSQVRTLRY